LAYGKGFDVPDHRSVAMPRRESCYHQRGDQVQLGVLEALGGYGQRFIELTRAIPFDVAMSQLGHVLPPLN
jgi:hypothetical protein